MNCPVCRWPAYVGFNSVECTNPECQHYKPVVKGQRSQECIDAAKEKPATPGWNHWLSVKREAVPITPEVSPIAFIQKRYEDQGGRTEICRWTMQNSPEGEKCRYIGWIDEHGNRNVALDDAFCKTQRQWWVIQPPVGKMEFGFKNVGEPFELSPAMKTVPGSDKVEDHFVIPETMTAKVVPSCFEAMWQIAKPIQNCDEGSHLIGHYEKYKGA